MEAAKLYEELSGTVIGARSLQFKYIIRQAF